MSEANYLLAEQAASWLLALRGGELTAAQRAEFVDWLRESPTHISELLRVNQLHRQLAKFEGWRDIAPLEDMNEANLLQLLTGGAAGGDGDVGRGALGAARGHRTRNLALLAAGVAALCVTGLLVFSRMGQTEYRTLPSQPREVSLADGSLVEMAADSDVLVRYRKHERLLTLAYGQALFHVAKNPERPFIVQAALTRVRAVGTVFNVERGAQGVAVTVVEGRVAVSQQLAATDPGNDPANAAESAASMLSLGANEQVLISANGVSSGVHRVEQAAQGGLAEEQLSFDNESVAEVVRRFNLRNSVKIEIDDAALATRRVSGVFRASDPQSFVAFVQAAADAEVSQRDATHLVLGRASTNRIKQ
jgi:transmembrane sensor